MTRRVFRGRDLAAVSAQARAALGDDALVLRTSTVRVAGATLIEIVAAASRDVASFRKRMTPGPLSRGPGRETRGSENSDMPDPRVPCPDPRPFILALVGPTGAGKTTTAVKLAIHPEALGGRTVGFITLDTYRAGAVAQLETYAGVAGLPLEVVYEPHEIAGALARLAHCDAIIVDTPGRGPKAEAADPSSGSGRALLAALAPDEVHLVIPATLRADVAEAVRDRLSQPWGADAVDAGATAPTHVILTKLDEVPDETGVASLAGRLDLPVRWIADGQAIPSDLAAGVPRLVAALAAGTPLDEMPSHAPSHATSRGPAGAWA